MYDPNTPCMVEILFNTKIANHEQRKTWEKSLLASNSQAPKHHLNGYQRPCLCPSATWSINGGAADLLLFMILKRWTMVFHMVKDSNYGLEIWAFYTCLKIILELVWHSSWSFHIVYKLLWAFHQTWDGFCALFP